MVIIKAMRVILAYAAASVIAMWGVAHLIPTRQVVAGFGAISTDNRRVITQEWLAEGIAMIGIAAFVVAATAADGPGEIRAWVYRTAACSWSPSGSHRPDRSAHTRRMVQDLPARDGSQRRAAANGKRHLKHERPARRTACTGVPCQAASGILAAAGHTMSPAQPI